MLGYGLSFNEIVPGKLWLGPGAVARHAERLQQVGITHIVNVTEDYDCEHPDKFKYLHVKVDDSEEVQLHTFFAEAHRFIDDALATDGKVYVHCAAGIRFVHYAMFFPCFVLSSQV